MENDKFFLQIPGKPEYISLARLMVSGIAANTNMDIELIEDLKIIVTELCNLSFIISPKKDICMAMNIESEQLKISVSGITESEIKKEEREISEMIINSLTDKLEYGDNYILVYKYF